MKGAPHAGLQVRSAGLCLPVAVLLLPLGWRPVRRRWPKADRVACEIPCTFTRSTPEVCPISRDEPLSPLRTLLAMIVMRLDSAV